MPKIDFLTTIKALLVHASSKQKNLQPPNFEAAGRLDRLAATAENIHEDVWTGHLKPAYEPLSPALMKAVRDLNDAIVAGTATPSNFDEYIVLLLAALKPPVMA